MRIEDAKNSLRSAAVQHNAKCLYEKLSPRGAHPCHPSKTPKHEGLYVLLTLTVLINTGTGR